MTHMYQIMESVCKFASLLIYLSFITAVCGSVDNSCRWNDYNFESLDEFAWTCVVSNGSVRTDYLFSLCRPLNSTFVGCQQNVSVCQISGVSGTSIGRSYPTFEGLLAEDTAKRELTLTLEGHDDCPEGSAGQKRKTFIIFKCGKTLGLPTFVDSYACDTYFEWLTTAACKSPPDVNETKCYVYDVNGRMRDLSPLVKVAGNYSVEVDEEDGGGEMFINVCRDMTKPSACSGSAACLFRNSSYFPLGSVQSDSLLQFDVDNSLYITYRMESSSSGCTSPATSKVTFRCPSRGKGRSPQLISSDECQYHVEWETEFACPASDLSSTTCQLHQPNHHIDIDLRPLATGRDRAFSLKTLDSSGTSYTYSLNICSANSTDAGISCGQSSGTSAVCQFYGTAAKSLGQIDKQMLRYSDRQLSLTYEGGDPCSSGFHRKTVINFHCNESAGRHGYPEFSGEDSCTYVFDWSTELACIPAPLDCQVSSAYGVKYDLSRLMRSEEVDDWHLHDSNSQEEDIFLNVCDDLTKKKKVPTATLR